MRHSSWLHAVVPTAHMLQMRELEVQRGDTACPRSHIYTSVHACQPSSWSRLTPSSMAAESPLQHITFKFLTHNEIKVSPLVTLAIFQKYNSHMSIAVPGQGVTESSSDWSSSHSQIPAWGAQACTATQAWSWAHEEGERSWRTSSESGGHGAEGLTSAGSFTCLTNSTPVLLINLK